MADQQIMGRTPAKMETDSNRAKFNAKPFFRIL